MKVILGTALILSLVITPALANTNKKPKTSTKKEFQTFVKNNDTRNAVRVKRIESQQTVNKLKRPAKKIDLSR